MASLKLIMQNSKVILKTMANYVLNITGIKDLYTGDSTVASNKINWTLQHYTKTASYFTTNNPILLEGQLGVESDDLTTTPKFKIGDGITDWNTLPYVSSGGGGSLSTVLGVGNSTSGNNVILTNSDVIKSSKVTNPSNFNFGSNGDEIQITNDDGSFTKAWLYGSDNEMSIGHVDNFIKSKVSDNTLYHDKLNKFDAPNNNFPQESANQIVYLNSGNNLKGAGFTPSAVELNTNKGVANGYPSLDSSGLIPASQLPSYIDDVLEYANLASFPAVGVTGIIYVDKATNLTYRWSGTIYVKLNDGAVTSFNSRTGAILPVGGDYTTDLVPDTLNKRYVTDAQLVVIGNTSNTNTGDETYATIVSKLGFTPGVGTIKGSVSATAGQIPFATGVADTVTSSDNQIFIDSNKRMQLGNTSGTTWDFHAYAFDAGTNSVVYGESGDFHLVSNARGLGTWTRYSLGKAINQYMYDGDMVTRTAVSGSAGSAITWIEQFKVKNAGGVGINDKSFFGDTATTATAYCDIKGGSSSNASFRLRQGVPTTTPLNGEMYQDGTDCYMYLAGTWKKLNV